MKLEYINYMRISYSSPYLSPPNILLDLAMIYFLKFHRFAKPTEAR